LITLCWVWYSYHSYIGEGIWCGIFWWFYQVPSLSSNHSSCFFEWARPFFYSSNCCPYIFEMLNTNQSCTCHSFPIGRLSYFSRCSSTCSNSITPSCSISNPTLWKLNSLILFLVTSFFKGSFIWIKMYFTFNKHSFKYYANTFSFMCGSKGEHLAY
jgi:hypothetical protein